MTMFLRLSDRYGKALNTFDPLASDWLMQLVDPVPGGDSVALPRTWRRILAVLVLFGPIWVFSALPSSTLGGRLSGRAGLCNDPGHWGIMAFMVGSLVLLPLARRVIGALINELVERGVVDVGLRRFSPSASASPGGLRFVEQLSRTARWRGVLWLGFFLALQLGVYWMLLNQGELAWFSSQAKNGSLLFYLRGGALQPNMAGLWDFGVRSPVMGYFILLALRLVVVFACLCRAVSSSASLTISPTHPDRSGGLKAIGQVSLLLSAFPILLGVDLLGLTAQEVYLAGTLAGNPQMTNNLQLQLVLWACYLVLTPILFLLPLAPLRARLSQAKRTYLSEAYDAWGPATRRHLADLEQGDFRQESVSGLDAFEALVQRASAMALWPVDRQTILRFAALLLSPLVPILIDRLAQALG